MKGKTLILFLLLTAIGLSAAIAKNNNPQGIRIGLELPWGPYSPKPRVSPKQQNVGIIVGNTLYSQIESRLSTYMNDVENNFGDVSMNLYTGDWDSPESLRAFIADKYSSDNLTGVVLVGLLPYAMWEWTRNPQDEEVCPIPIFYEDLDDDGTREVVSEINGTWNRVTVWTVDGKPLYDASFGPGARISGPGTRFPTKNMRDLDIADLDGDGKKEILAATSSGLVVALSHKCEKVWATKLPAPPAVMKVMTGKNGDRPNGRSVPIFPQIVVGCQGGSVYVLDAKGAIVRTGQITGTPTRVTALDDASVLLATDKGEVKRFNVGG